jgi:dihydroorotate dehydrogenase (fumarate)
MKLDLSTNYGGLRLKNPIVIGASNLVTNIDNLFKLQEAGAAAIVYKSLFEEQVEMESFYGQIEETEKQDAVQDSLFTPIVPASQYLRRLKEARSKITIPLIGSLNCVNDNSWLEYALKMQDTGIDALELNFYHTGIDFKISPEEVEAKHLRVLENVRAGITLPLFVKLSPFYSNILQLISRMDQCGVNGFILFNRLFQPDIDIEDEEHYYPYNFSSESDNRLSLRYAGLLHKNVHGSIISNTGIHQGKDVVKMLLAGADAVQVVSAIYKKGMQTVTHMLQEIEAWMNRKEYASLSEFHGKLSKINSKDPFAYRRAQYVDILMKSEVSMKYHEKRGYLEKRFEEDLED